MPLLLFLILALFLSASTVRSADPHLLSVKVFEGPSADGGSCPSSEDTITEGDYAKIHYTVFIDESSEVGEPGKQYESTLTDGNPIGVTLGHAEVIPGWDEGLVGLCKGDKVTLVVPPHLAYGDKGTGDDPDDIPGGATIRFDIEIVSVMEGPSEEEDDEEAMAMFDNADTDKDGKLSRPEFDAMFAAQIGEVSDAEEMAAIQEQLQKFWDSQDDDKDGYLSLEEFLAPSTFDTDDLDDMDSHSPQEEFNALDTDNDGKLSRQEIEDFFSSLEQEVPDDFWEHLDENKDGFITYDEFFVEGDEEDYDEGDEDEEDGDEL